MNSPRGHRRDDGGRVGSMKIMLATLSQTCDSYPKMTWTIIETPVQGGRGAPLLSSKPPCTGVFDLMEPIAQRTERRENASLRSSVQLRHGSTNSIDSCPSCGYPPSDCTCHPQWMASLCSVTSPARTAATTRARLSGAANLHHSKCPIQIQK